MLSGPGSDLTEEPASRDVEPVTLAAESFPFVLPGPSAPDAARVGDELAVDRVARGLFVWGGQPSDTPMTFQNPSPGVPDAAWYAP